MFFITNYSFIIINFACKSHEYEVVCTSPYLRELHNFEVQELESQFCHDSLHALCFCYPEHQE